MGNKYLKLRGAYSMLESAREHIYNILPSSCDNGCETCDAGSIISQAEAKIVKEMQILRERIH